MTVRGSTNTAEFKAYVEHFLLSDLKRGDVVVLDNYGPHKSAKTLGLIEDKGATAIFLPPYMDQNSEKDISSLTEPPTKFRRTILDNAWQHIASNLSILLLQLGKDLRNIF